MKMNKKGFTLIELLAVIIILGVLMIIAIPSVTTYIQNSRKSAWVDTSVAYVKSTVNKVNEGGKLQFFTEKVLYMVPVGHVAKSSCVSVESGGQSPFSDTWRYAYVGVVYNGKGYDYYFIGEDAAGQGIEFVSQKYLNDKGTDAMYSVTKVATGNGQKMLADAYSGTSKIAANYIYIAFRFQLLWILLLHKFTKTIITLYNYQSSTPVSVSNTILSLSLIK